MSEDVAKEEPQKREIAVEHSSNAYTAQAVKEHDLRQFNDTIQVLRQALELKERGGLSEFEYGNIKINLLENSGIQASASKSTTISKTTSVMADQAIREATIGLYAGELHDLIVQQIEENYRLAAGSDREYMLSLVTKLSDLGAIYPQDKPYLNHLIDVVSTKPEVLENGLRNIEGINEEVRKNVSTSETAKALTGTAYRSARRAIDSLSSQKTKEPQEAEKTLWGVVKDDVIGGLTGAQTVASIAALPGFSLPAIGFVAALGAPVVWLPAIGVVLGAGVMSGIQYANARSARAPK